MESCRHLKGAFDSFDLEIMERALDAALRTLKAHHVMDARGEDDLKSFMGHKLTAIANVHGVSDAATLRGRLLGEIPLPSSPDFPPGVLSEHPQ
jgi:hypothetical protein